MAPHLPGGSVAGLDLLHLQCHIGTDTLSFARLGARRAPSPTASTSSARRERRAHHEHRDLGVEAPLPEVVTVLLDAGPRVTSPGEQTTMPWRALPQMVEEDTPHGRSWVLPAGRRRLPLPLSLTAVEDG